MSLPETFVKSFHDENVVKKMPYIRLGKTNLNVSKVSLGGGAFSHFYGSCDETEAIETIQLAIRQGINYIDTGYWYGQGTSERILGKALADVPREAYYIATKVGRYELETKKRFDFSAKTTRESVDRSLNHLGVDYVDIIQIHDVEFAPDFDILLNETLPTLEEIVKEGKARFIGITGYPVEVLKRFIEACPGRIDMILTYSRFTMFDQTLKDFMDFFKSQDIGVVCASGHGMGLLTNNGPQAWHPAGEAIKEKCLLASNMCKTKNMDLARLAMDFAMSLEGAATFLCGMQTRDFLTVNLSVLIGSLTEEEKQLQRDLLDNIFSELSHTHWEGVELATYREKMSQ